MNIKSCSQFFIFKKVVLMIAIEIEKNRSIQKNNLLLTLASYKVWD